MAVTLTSNSFFRYPVLISQACAFSLSIHALMILGPLPSRAINVPLLIAIIFINSLSVIMCGVSIASTFTDLGIMLIGSLSLVAILGMMSLPMMFYLIRSVNQWCYSVIDAANASGSIPIPNRLSQPEQAHIALPLYEPLDTAPPYEQMDYVYHSKDSDALSDVISSITRLSEHPQLTNSHPEMAIV
jgi:hypothetical protein